MKSLIFKVLLVILTIFPRFFQLGYSHFYGDETKTFYLDKTLSAPEFFLQQRKGPVQFLVVWVMEKLTGGHNEFFTRLPFAIAGTLAVLVFYLYVHKKFSHQHKYVALIATYIFSLSGFFIAFSRTAQYQSFLILFGLLALLLWEYKKPLLSGIFLGLAFLCHYDAVFYIVPLIPDFIKNHKKTLFKFFSPAAVLAGAFYLPYIIKGYFASNTLTYLAGRVTGAELLPNNSLWTYTVYNPNLASVLIYLASIVPFFKKKTPEIWQIALWFVVPFILFEFVFSNPGTHIYNYLIPLMILSALGIVELVSNKGFLVVITVAFSLIAATSVTTYVPALSKGHPWNTNINKDKYQLFLYGFPYNRGWEQVRTYIKQKGGAENFFTNDNVTVGEYYMYPNPSYKYHPVYYIYVEKNQLYLPFKEDVVRVFNYAHEKDFYVNGEKTISIFKRMERRPVPLWEIK